MSKTPLRLLVLFGALIMLGGCAQHYVPPGRGADMNKLVAPEVVAQQTDVSVEQVLKRRPLAAFPTGIAMARVQASGYQSHTATGYGAGAYCVVTTRDVEADAQIERLTKLPMVHGVAPMSRLLLPQRLDSDLQLRQAAARLNADLLLIYTLDTEFFTEDKAAPLTFISLGLSPNQQARVTCTASALLLDTRNGYVYGAAEATEKQSQLASAWTSQSAIDDSRRRAETKAFERLVGELERTWTGVVQAYAVNPAAAAPPAR